VSAGGTNGLYLGYSGPAPFGTWEHGVFGHSDLQADEVGRNGYTRFWHDGRHALDARHVGLRERERCKRRTDERRRGRTLPKSQPARDAS
jgi:hypothetical protein